MGELLTPMGLIAIAGFLVAAVTAIALFGTLRHTKKITRCETYQRLELASIDLFRFEVEHSDIAWKLYNPKFDIINSLDRTVGIDTAVSSKEKREILNHVTQLLNLFELGIELHDKNVFDHKIFTTWLAWIFETAEFKTFQDMWEHEWDKEQEEEPLCNHYTGYLVGLVNYAIEIHKNDKISKDKFEIFTKSLCEKRLVCNKWKCKKEWRRNIIRLFKLCSLEDYLEKCNK